MAVVDVTELDVDALNDAAAALWDEAHGRGARAGREEAITELVEYHGGKLRALVGEMLDAAIKLEGEERWRLAHFASRLLSITLGSGSGAYATVAWHLREGVPSSGVAKVTSLRKAREALAAMDGGA